MTSVNGITIDTSVVPQIPVGAEPLSNQVAGHRFGISRHKLGLLKHSESGDILKPIYDNRGQRELQFYQTLFDSANDHDECIVAFRQLVSHFNGLFHDSRMKMDYIRLHNATDSLPDASVLDIKIGSVTYDPDASEDKRLIEKNKYRYSKELGFRILGMTICDNKTKMHTKRDKDYGLHITPEGMAGALLEFCQNDAVVLREFQQQLGKIEKWFRHDNVDRWQFISSSLLMVYGHESATLASQGKLKVIIKVIDFAHVFPNHGVDTNYLFGLSKLKHHLQLAIDRCLEHHPKPNPD